MSDNATLEIKKFDGKRDLRSEIIIFNYGNSSVVSPAISSGRVKVDKLTVQLPHGDADYLAFYWHRDSEKIYPEMTIKGKFSSGANGTRTRAIFTFYQVTVKGYGNDKSGSGEDILMLKFGFEKSSYVLDSTAGVLK